MADREDKMEFTVTTQEKNKNKNQGMKNQRRKKEYQLEQCPILLTKVNVKVAAVSEDSQELMLDYKIGDIIKKLMERFKTLKNSDMLKEHQPGDEITLTVERNEKLRKLN